MDFEKGFNDRQDASMLAKFSPRMRRTLEALKRSGTAEQLERAAETEIIEERRGLLAELAATTKAYTAKVRPLETAAGNALRAYEEAEKALASARNAMHATSNAANGHELTFLAVQKRIKDELRLSADRRIVTFCELVDNIRSEDLPGALRFGTAEGSPTGKGRRGLHVVSNTEQCAAARAAIKDALTAAEALIYEPIGYVELSERMNTICATLAPVLEAVSLNPPSLTAADAEPGPPVPFKGQSVWIVDKAVSIRGEEVTARRADAAARIAASARVN